MNNNELEDNSIEKISYSKQKKTGIKFSRSANSFVSWCKNTIMSSVVLTTIKLAWGVFIIFIIFIIVFEFFGVAHDVRLTSNNQNIFSKIYWTLANEDKNCSVSGIKLRGDLVTYNQYQYDGEENTLENDISSSDHILEKINSANKNENIKAIVIEVDSGGGSPVAGEEISNVVSNSRKPVVSYIRSIGASASYLSISGADKIFASKYSDIGGIGVTASYLSNVNKNNKDGYTYEQLSVGKFKDSGDPNKPLTEEERSLFMRDANIIYDDFVKMVADNRGLPITKVRIIADGSTVLGQKAKELGLIDEIGGIEEAKKYLEEITEEDLVICWGE